MSPCNKQFSKDRPEKETYVMTHTRRTNVYDETIYQVNKAIQAIDTDNQRKNSIHGQNIDIREKRLTVFQKFWNIFIHGLGILVIGIAVFYLIIFLIV